MKCIILATQNSHKKQKLGWMVKGFFKEMKEMPGKLEIEENGETFEENAKIKASAAAKRLGNYTIATDGGALIPALGRKWNALLTRRFVGKKEVSDWERIDALLAMMKGIRGPKRKVEWREAVAIADPLGKVIYSVEVEGDTGLIQESYRKDQYREGIWLCTLTCYPQFGGKNFFELNQEEQKAGEISWWRLKEKVTGFLKGLDISNQLRLK